MEIAPIAVVETPEFLAVTRKLMDDEDRAALVDYLARNPEAGDIIAGDWRREETSLGFLEGRGKRGGARVIYFFHSVNIPLFALSAYAKNAQADLSQSDRNDFKRLTKLLAETYGKVKP